ncbi:hypothetical protein PSAC2689_10076 [Paraburkholderia sacchari]
MVFLHPSGDICGLNRCHQTIKKCRQKILADQSSSDRLPVLSSCAPISKYRHENEKTDDFSIGITVFLLIHGNTLNPVSFDTKLSEEEI